jgi:glucose-1-phosphate thymidylyltransferase
MKGILLAGGSGTRLYPATMAVSKQLLPVYDKPAIYYPLSVLMLAGIRDVAIVSTPRDVPLIQGLLGSGERLGMRFSYFVQPKPEGIAQAFLIAEPFIQGSPVTLILGDNIFYGNDFMQVVVEAVKHRRGAEIFAYRVQDPERFGVVEFDSEGRVLSLEEKPKQPKTPWAVPGLYVYADDVVARVKRQTPSARGELEITDLNKAYLEDGRLYVHALGRGVAWLDSGTPDSLLQASHFVQVLEQRQGLKVACIEEIALHKGFIDLAKLEESIRAHGASAYGTYLRQVAQQFSGGSFGKAPVSGA